jgi:hypothetical protein
MDVAADQEGPRTELTESLMARVRRIPQLVDRRVLLIKATGGYKFMERFAASEAEVRAAAEKSIAQMCALQMRLAVAEDLLRNTSIINRCIETYEERVKELLVELVGPKVIEAATERKEEVR